MLKETKPHQGICWLTETSMKQSFDSSWRDKDSARTKPFHVSVKDTSSMAIMILQVSKLKAAKREKAVQ